jgi:hypothetical protein
VRGDSALIRSSVFRTTDPDLKRPVSARLLDIRSDGIVKLASKTQASLAFTTTWTSEVGGTSPFFSGRPGKPEHQLAT